MFLNNIKGIISYITISAITICFFSLIGQNIFFDELNIIPFGLVPIIGSVAYIVVGFFILDSSRKPVFSSVISVAVILETLALVTFAMEGQYPSDILYCYTNIVYVMVLGLYGPLMIAPILPSLFMCIGIVIRRRSKKCTLPEGELISNATTMNIKAILALILGSVSIVCAVFMIFSFFSPMLGVAGFIVGILAKKEIAVSAELGIEYATAGIVYSMIGPAMLITVSICTM